VIRDLGDHYAAIGGAAAALAAERAAGDDVERLQQAAAGLAKAHTPREQRRAEGLFHIEVAAAAQSVRLTREEIGLQRDVAPLLWLVTNRSEEQIVQEHVDLAQAIADHDTGSARRYAEDHILVAVKAALRLQRDLLHAEGSRVEAMSS
jgi:DNA-binding FadR family transcriptional regulator